MSHTNSYIQTRSRPLAPAPGQGTGPAPTPPSSVMNGSQGHIQRHASRPRAADRYASMESTTGTSPQAPRLEAHQLPPLQDGISLPSSLLPLPNSNSQSAPQPMDYVVDSPVDSPLMLSQSGGVNGRGYEVNETQNNSQVSQEHELLDELARLRSDRLDDRQLVGSLTYKTNQNTRATVKLDYRIDRLEQEVREMKRNIRR